MANIAEHLKKVLTAVYGRDVRNSYHDALKAINEETESTTLRQQTVENRQDALEGKYDTQIKNITDSNPSNVEIVDMRTDKKGNTFQTAGKRLDNFDLQLGEIKKPTIRGTNMLLGESATEELLKNRINLYKELNINACIIVQHLKINLDWTYTIDATKEKIELACRLLKESGILPMGIKFHFNFNPSMLSNVTDLPDSFINAYKTTINDYMKVASRHGADSVIILNEMDMLTNYRNPSECLDKIKNLITYTKGLGYKVSMSMNFPMINNCDDSIIDMLDFICFNNYPCVSYEGLEGSKKKALEMLEMSSFANGCISKAGNRKVYMSEIGCLDHELSLSAPELTDERVTKEPTCGGKAKAYFWDVVLKWFESQNQIDGLFMWDGVTEFRPYEPPAKDAIKKYWKVSDKLC